MIFKKVKKYLLAFCAAISLGNAGYAQTDFYDIKVSKDSCCLAKDVTFPRTILKTNIVHDAMIVPNIGIERYLGNGYSLGATYWYTWWKTSTYTKSNYRKWRSYGGEIELRKYLGYASRINPLSGHHVGVFTQGYMYDYNPRGKKGQMSDLTYAAGIEYGYSFPVDKRLNLDLGIGLGYRGGRYKSYIQDRSHYVWQYTRQRNYFGPIKLEISFSCLLGKNNFNLNSATL